MCLGIGGHNIFISIIDEMIHSSEEINVIIFILFLLILWNVLTGIEQMKLWLIKYKFFLYKPWKEKWCIIMTLIWMKSFDYIQFFLYNIYNNQQTVLVSVTRRILFWTL